MTTMVEDFKKPDGTWAKTTRSKEGVLSHTRSYRRWNAFMVRCSGKYKYEYHDFDKYHGTTAVSEDWKGKQGYQNFVEWHRKQIGYLDNDYVIDKDILGGNSYSADNCVLVPKTLNLLMSKDQQGRKYQRGVSFHNNKYRAEISFERKSTVIQCDTEAEAISTYKTLRNELVDSILERISSGNILVDEKVVSLIKAWKLP